MCRKCYKRGHPTSHCLHHTLTIILGNIQEDEPIDEIAHLVVSDIASESEHEEDERRNHLSIIRCLLSCIGRDSWKCTVIFQTKMPCKDKILYLVIDNGSCINVILKYDVRLLNLESKPCSTPIKVAWVEKTTMIIFRSVRSFYS